MQHPVGKDLQDYRTNWYNAQKFGIKVSTNYYHEGDDLNRKDGKDEGENLYAVAGGTIRYYHNSSHPTKGFGKHMVLEVKTPEGLRWFMYSHCKEITAEVKTVEQGEVIGKLGNTGNSTGPHLHFSCIKVDPINLPNGIDFYAKSESDLNEYWESPLDFIEKYLNDEPEINWEQILKKKLPDEAWRMLIEFQKLDDLDLIIRDDSIQSQLIKWLESHERQNDEIDNLSADLETSRQNLNNSIKSYIALEKTIADEKLKAFAEGRETERDRIMIELEIRKAGEPKLPANFDFEAWKLELLKASEGKFNQFINFLTQIWQTSPKIP